MKLTKSELEKLISEAAADYVWGVKKPGRVANQYGLSTLKIKKLISEEFDKLHESPPLARVYADYLSRAAQTGEGALEDVGETLPEPAQQYTDYVRGGIQTGREALGDAGEAYTDYLSRAMQTGEDVLGDVGEALPEPVQQYTDYLGRGIQTGREALFGPRRTLRRSTRPVGAAPEKAPKMRETIKNEIDKLFEDTTTTPAGIAVDRPDDSVALSRSGAAEMDVFENQRDKWAKTIEEIVQWATNQEKDPAGVIPSATAPPNPDFVKLIGEDFNALMGLISDALKEKDRIEQQQNPPIAGG